MASTESLQASSAFDHDVVIVGGGPAGCSAGVFTGRYDLDTVIFDRGRSSLQRCAFLENYLGFPAGIDIETLYDLMHDHAERAGCEIIPDLVESVDRRDVGGGFVVGTQEGEGVTARRVIAATRYDGKYMRGLDDETAMFETHDHGGEEHEHFERDYAAHDGTTPIEGLYVASPSEEADHQAIMAAGRGARVGLTVVAAVREEQGLPDESADHYDWVRQQAELDDEWSTRDRWREYFEERTPDEYDLSEDRLMAFREQEIDRRFDSYIAADEVSERTREGHRRLADHLSVTDVLEAVDSDRMLEHIDDDTVLEAARTIEADGQSNEVSD